MVRAGTSSLLEVEKLSVTFQTSRGEVAAVDGIDLRLNKGDTLAIVGESGSGKSTLALALMRLVPSPPGVVQAGTLRFEGENLLAKSNREMRRLRGAHISMIFQEPMSSLNPLVPVGVQVAESLWTHQRMNRREAEREALRLMELVGIPRARERFRDFPHNFSGGMCQRVMIASSIACRPKLLIADEPTTALDATVQAQIIELLAQLREELGMAIILITHNLGIVPQLCDRVMVLYSGRVAEVGNTREVLTRPAHPYTVSLLRSVPRLDQDDTKPLFALGGRPPSAGARLPGCLFGPRCPRRDGRCDQSAPKLEEVRTNHSASCFHPESNLDRASA